MTRNELPRGHNAVPKVVVIDDDVQLAEGVVRALKSRGYAAEALHTGADALGEIARAQPDLVLLDVMMPSVDGWEVLRRLRGQPATSVLPIIMLTAADSENAKVKGFTLGADDYVTKPFSLDVLCCRIDAVLKRSGIAGASDESSCCIQVVSGSAGVDLIPVSEVCYIEGIRNYTYVHTYDSRHLSRLTLGALDERQLRSFMRVHRSFIVNLDHVAGCGWVRKGAFRLRMRNRAGTEVSVSRSLVPEVQRRLGVRE